jgi:uncharacterized pyridoxal phosphate-dependent enzyme
MNRGSKLGVYEELDVVRLVNAEGRWTGLGGSVMRPEVVEAMRDGARSYVDIVALQRAVGEAIAKLTQNEAAYVTVGAAAGVAVATLACITRGDVHAIARLPDTADLPTEIVIHTGHRFPFDLAVPLALGKIVQVGNAYRTGPEELEAVLSGETAAVLYVAGSHVSGALPLSTTVEIAHSANVPVIVDAAAQLPPRSNLWHFSKELGADLVIFSGGKELRGPQASGLIVGKSEFIEACRAVGAPSPHYLRALKTGKEEIVGLYRAVQSYLDRDEDAWLASLEEAVQLWLAVASKLPGVTGTRIIPNIDGQPTPRARLAVDPSVAQVNAGELRNLLRAGSPSIAVGLDGEEAILLTPDTLIEDSEADLIAERLKEYLSADK